MPSLPLKIFILPFKIVTESFPLRPLFTRFAVILPDRITKLSVVATALLMYPFTVKLPLPEKDKSSLEYIAAPSASISSFEEISTFSPLVTVFSLPFAK